PGDLRERSAGAVVEIVLLRCTRARVARPAAPEDGHVVAVAVLDVVEAARVVDLPRDVRVLEQVEDDRPAIRVEDAVAPEAVRRDPARRSGHEIEAVRPR